METNLNPVKIIAVDFDGCLFENKYPKIGAPIHKNIDKLLEEQKKGAKVILWTNRCGTWLDEAIAACLDHGIYFDAVNENLPEIVKAWGGSDPRKIFANEYWDDRAVLMNEKDDVERLLSLSGKIKEKSRMELWAENEVKVACEFEKKGSNENDGHGDWDYGCACYESALKAYKSLLGDGHSGMSISITKHILNRLIDGKPLRPITDEDDSEWGMEDIGRLDGSRCLQNKRYSSLFKTIHPDGTVTYDDVDSVICEDIHSHSTYTSALERNIVSEMFPINMPYMPVNQIRVFTEDFATDKKRGDLDTVAVLYLVKPSGEKIYINRFFKEPDSGNGWVEISEKEYSDRRAHKIQ